MALNNTLLVLVAGRAYSKPQHSFPGTFHANYKGVFQYMIPVRYGIHTYYFLRDKTAVLGEIKAQLPFSEGKY